MVPPSIPAVAAGCAPVGAKVVFDATAGADASGAAGGGPAGPVCARAAAVGVGPWGLQAVGQPWLRRTLEEAER